MSQTKNLPDHLRQFIVDQRYDDYTSVDHAVWRFIMRQNVHFLKEHAHRVYFQGLLDTGISFDRIPRIEEMNAILGRIGWGAVAVDGFIPPAAFMEFQAYKVLVIACDMRQVEHIEYTPAPDIVHEAAGHAPIIVDKEYADYLRRFGEVGAKAMSSKKDFELYEAIRHLSILKERPNTPPEEIEAAAKDVEYKQANLGAPSEMALLSRLHWWTVEYGLIGDMELPKIYGAGLLSSIGESVSCLEAGVKKIPYTLDAQNFAFDITTQQPQLFVTSDFKHLSKVLEEFAAKMAFSVGGMQGLNKAIECANVSTIVYRSGLQVTGQVVEALNESGRPYYIKLTGPSALAYNYKQLEGHGRDYHKDGFGSPVGRLRGIDKPLEDLSDTELNKNKISQGEMVTLEFESGVTVKGRLENVRRYDGKINLMTFSDCTVEHGSNTLFQPEWGAYDMAVGESIDSVFSGAADKDAFQQISLVPKERTIKIEYDEQARKLQGLYKQLREIRDNKRGHDDLKKVWSSLQTSHPKDWLGAMEIVEILERDGLFPELKEEITAYLREKQKIDREHEVLIDWGFRLIDFFATGELQIS